MVFDFRAIERLAPDERVPALQRLRVELNKEIERRKKQIEESNEEIRSAEKLLERAEEELVVLLNVKTPGNKSAAIDELFFKKGRREDAPLEELADIGMPKRQVEDDDVPKPYLIAERLAEENRPKYDSNSPSAFTESRKEKTKYIHGQQDDDDKPYKSDARFI